ncbi:MAG: signal peptidase [Salinirussus sp.]
MSGGRWVTRLAQVSVVVLVLALAAGQLLGQPVLLGFVETGSMAPTLGAGDGFIAVPAALAGQVEPGDVVTYRAETIDGGGLTTHRVVEATDRGYVTRGDANSFTDQSSGEPPVKQGQIVAVAWRPGASVLVVPGLGTAVEGVRGVLGGLQRTLAGVLGTGALLGPTGVAWVIAGVSILLYLADVGLADTVTRDTERRTDRAVTRATRPILAGFALLLVAGMTVAMVAPAGTTEYTVISAEFESEQPTVVPAGETATLNQSVRNTGVVPVQVYLVTEGERAAVRPDRLALGPGAERNVSVTVRAPPETGAYRQFVTEHRYLSVLPSSALDALYSAHPWLPLLAVNAAVGGGFYLLGRAVVGGGRIVTRQDSREGPSGGRWPFNR